MKTIILNQRKERDELMSRPYLIRKSIQDTDLLLSSHLIKLITGPRRVGKSTQALLMLRDKNFAYLNFDNYQLLETWDANLVMRMLDDVYKKSQFSEKVYAYYLHYLVRGKMAENYMALYNRVLNTGSASVEKK